jgi:hypothetical protein
MKLIDEKIVDNACNYFQLESKNPLPIKEDTQVIEEGIKYFKISPRLYKLALKLEKKSLKVKDSHEQYQEIDRLVKKINALANNFETLEDKYYLGDKAQKAVAKNSYKQLLVQYNDIIKMMRKSEIIDALKQTGSLAFTVAGMALPYIAMSHFFPDLLSVNAINQNSNTMDKAFLYCKRAGAFTLCGLPLKITRAGINALTDDTEAKILARTDKILRDSNIDTKEYSDDELHQLS